MKILIIIVFFLCSCSIKSDLSDSSPEGYTESSFKEPYEENVNQPDDIITNFKPVKTSNRGFYQDKFVLSSFKASTDISYNSLIEYKKAYFNYTETQFMTPDAVEKLVQLCEEIGGIRVLVQEKENNVGHVFQHENINYEDYVNFLAKYSKYSSFGGIYVWDEPEIYDFSLVKRQMDIIQELSPGTLGFSVIFPSVSINNKWFPKNHQNLYSDYVDRYVSEVSPYILSFDHYPFDNTKSFNEFNKSSFWRDLSYHRMTGLENDIVTWFYYQSVGDLIDFKPMHYLSDAHIRVQAFAAIMYGVKGLSSFLSSNGTVGENGVRGYLYEATKQMNFEIMNLGNLLMSLNSTGVYHGDKIVNDPYAENISKNPFVESIPKDMSIGIFKDNLDNDYILFLNRNFTTFQTVNINLKENYRVYKCSKYETGRQYIMSNSSDVIKLKLTPGNADLYRIQKPGDIADPIIFK